MKTASEIDDEQKKPIGICVPCGDELIAILFADILYVESDNNYCRIYCVEQTQPYTARITIKEMVAILPANDFQRIHDRYIVDEKLIKRFNSGRTRLRISADKWLPVSRRYRKILMQLFLTAVSK